MAHSSHHERGPTPPPSYESITTPKIPLCYIDFMPQCLEQEKKMKYAQFETFDKLIVKANVFLRSRPDVLVKSVETVAKKCAYLQDIYSGKMYTDKLAFRHIVIYGLRVWFTIIQVRMTALELAYVNIIPVKLPSLEDSDYPNFQKLERLFEAFNRKLLIDPLPGQIVSIETVSIKIDKDTWFKFDGNFDWDSCSWYDGYKHHLFNFTRIFYLKGSPANELIGIEDITPNRLDGKEDGIPKYESFNLMFKRAQQWIYDNIHTQKKLVNVKTIETPYFGTSLQESAGLTGRCHVIPGMSFCDNLHERGRVYFLRISYVVSRDSNLPRPELTYRTFVPGHDLESTIMEYQSLDDLMNHINSWIRVTKTNVVYAETCECRLNAVKHDGILGTECTSTGCSMPSDPTLAYRVIYFIRLYINGGFYEPAPELLDAVPSYPEKSDCDIL
ncbi:uncharacterized protein LOC141899763 [Tubulanus polymorphus]|uniref:uncharacterized protein LOC141899763 n=1 Tax=Tubulanus polymorphus TaxID=672921 RepID=UPI003DA3576D